MTPAHFVVADLMSALLVSFLHSFPKTISILYLLEMIKIALTVPWYYNQTLPFEIPGFTPGAPMCTSAELPIFLLRRDFVKFFFLISHWACEIYDLFSSHSSLNFTILFFFYIKMGFLCTTKSCLHCGADITIRANFYNFNFIRTNFYNFCSLFNLWGLILIYNFYNYNLWL